MTLLKHNERVKELILGDRDLRYYLKRGIIKVEPYDPVIVRENGLDLRLGNQMARLRETGRLLDTSRTDNPPEEFYEVVEGDEFVINPFERVLLTTLEYIKMPEDLMAFVNLRSSYARLGLMIPPTIVDSGFEGNITIEVVGSSFPVKLHSGERFIHLIFARVSSPVESPYKGVYQGQIGVRLPRFFAGSK